MFNVHLTLPQDKSGAVAVEFALIAPVMIAMMLGVFQIGLGMHNFNAIRSASSEVARYAVICHQREDATCMGDAALETWGANVATRAPYGLASDRLVVSVDTVAVPQVAGAQEKTISIRYTVPSVLGVIGIDDVVINYSRPVFLIS